MMARVACLLLISCLILTCLAQQAAAACEEVEDSASCTATCPSCCYDKLDKHEMVLCRAECSGCGEKYQCYVNAKQWTDAKKAAWAKIASCQE
ncbi:unnamed protein product [Cyprideis torosa]|uniref:Uncharacterized protein n=1 Tax=Cyprideis torosa TaxID=163714 RepID=A0A7R8ZKZ1_9CRUS|nr:unnamed protein product [Cyprideis torosa]CAG0890539.1 unnamed protein product [Cyprideis torosa]